MPLRNVATTFTIEQQRLEINALAGDVNNIATGVTNVGTAATANALAAGATGEDLTLSGTLTVNGTQTILNTETLQVEDKEIVIGNVATPTDATAHGGGWKLKGANNKTITYNQTGDKWESNKPFEASNLLYNSGNQELNGHLAVNTTDATIAGNGPFVVHIDTDKNIGTSGGLSEIGNVPGIVAFHDSGALQDFGMRGVTLRFAAGSAERLRITDNGLNVNANHDVRFENGTWSGEVPGKIQHNSNWLYLQGGTSGIKFRNADGSLNTLECDDDGNASFTGTVSDDKGHLRRIPLQDESGGAYVLVASDAGQCVHAHGSTTQITVNQNVFSPGDAVSIVNGDASDLTITQGSSFNLRNTGDGSTGDRTLSQFGMATIYFSGHNVGYISGAGLS